MPNPQHHRFAHFGHTKVLRRLKWLAAIITILALLLGGGYLFTPQYLMRALTMIKVMQAGLKERKIQVNDTIWSYYEGGQGPTIVLLHGFHSDKNVWLALAKRLTPSFHLVIPDLPGWGQSSRLAEADYGISAQTARLATFLSALKLKSVALLAGHSMGGEIAGVYAAGHNRQIDKLALLDSSGLEFRQNAYLKAVRAGKNPFIYDDHAGFKRYLALVFKRVPHIRPRFIDVLIERNVHDIAFIKRLFTRLHQPPQVLALQHHLSQLRMPVLALWCQDDRVIDISALNILRSKLTHASIIHTTVLQDCGHVPMMEKPAETAQILTAFADNTKNFSRF